jgi:hypothetical protein
LSPPAGSAPGGIAFAHGLFAFSLQGCAGAVNLTIAYPQPLPSTTRYYKYGPTPDNATPHWYVLPSSITANTATFILADGALGDDDLTANGTIVDQGGPGNPPEVSVPTLSEWSLVLLALLLAGAAVIAMR